MSNSSFSKMRDRDFAGKMRRTADFFRLQGKHASRDAIIEATLKCRPESFYVATSTACANLRKLKDSQFPDPKDIQPAHIKRLLWLDMYKKVHAYRYRNPDVPFENAVNHILTISRPDCFYISPVKAKRIFYDTFTRQSDYVPR